MLLVYGLLFATLLCSHVHGHGYLAVPGARNSMWRLGFDTPKNYDDMGLNCGGQQNQWENNGGKCGLCGDPYQAASPRLHGAGGTYAPLDRGISRCYNQNDQVMDITVRLTAHHLGYLEFRLLENNDMSQDPPDAAIDNGRLLAIAGSGGLTKYDVSQEVKEFYYFQLELPNDVTCTQCILHWKYHAGNSWGCDESGCGDGLGAQEEFINCADIAILPDCTSLPTAGTPGTTNSAPPVTSGAPTSWTQGPTQGPQPTGSPCAAPCRAIGLHAGDAVVDRFCNINCFNPDGSYCPVSHCQCD